MSEALLKPAQVARKLGTSPFVAKRIMKAIPGSFVEAGERLVPVDAFDRWRATAATNGCPEHASKASDVEEPPTICGVYLLILRGRVVYVGQTTDLYMRLRSHRREKDYDHARVIEVPNTSRGTFRALDAAERALILALEPELNRGAPVGDIARRDEWDEWLRISEVRGWIAFLRWGLG